MGAEIFFVFLGTHLGILRGYSGSTLTCYSWNAVDQIQIYCIQGKCPSCFAITLSDGCRAKNLQDSNSIHSKNCSLTDAWILNVWYKYKMKLHNMHNMYLQGIYIQYAVSGKDKLMQFATTCMKLEYIRKNIRCSHLFLVYRITFQGNAMCHRGYLQYYNI